MPASCSRWFPWLLLACHCAYRCHVMLRCTDHEFSSLMGHIALKLSLADVLSINISQGAFMQSRRRISRSSLSGVDDLTSSSEQASAVPAGVVRSCGRGSGRCSIHTRDTWPCKTEHWAAGSSELEVGSPEACCALPFAAQLAALSI